MAKPKPKHPPGIQGKNPLGQIRTGNIGEKGERPTKLARETQKGRAGGQQTGTHNKDNSIGNSQHFGRRPPGCKFGREAPTPFARVTVGWSGFCWEIKFLRPRLWPFPAAVATAAAVRCGSACVCFVAGQKEKLSAAQTYPPPLSLLSLELRTLKSESPSLSLLLLLNSPLLSRHLSARSHWHFCCSFGNL